MKTVLIYLAHKNIAWKFDFIIIIVFLGWKFGCMITTILSAAILFWDKYVKI
jgi:hypothetical protein